MLLARTLLGDARGTEASSLICKQGIPACSVLAAYCLAAANRLTEEPQPI